MSDRVKLNKLKVDSINNKETFFEICDSMKYSNYLILILVKSHLLLTFQIMVGYKPCQRTLKKEKVLNHMYVLCPECIKRSFDKHGQRLLEQCQNFLNLEEK